MDIVEGPRKHELTGLYLREGLPSRQRQIFEGIQSFGVLEKKIGLLQIFFSDRGNGCNKKNLSIDEGAVSWKMA